MEDIEMTAEENEVDVEEVEDTTDSSSVAEDGQDAEAEFTDTEENEADNIEVESKPKQDSKTNSEYARRRREAERQKAIEDAKRQARLDAFKEMGATNKYTGEPIEDETDLEVYNAMKSYEAKGGDPLADQSKIYKQVLAKNKADNEDRAKFDKDMREFEKKHPDVDVSELLDNEKFKKFAKGKIGTMPMNEIYEDFADFYPTAPKTNDVEVKREAVRKSTVGSLNGQKAPQSNGYYTEKQLAEMTREQVLADYDKVMASMEYNNRKKRR